MDTQVDSAHLQVLCLKSGLRSHTGAPRLVGLERERGYLKSGLCLHTDAPIMFELKHWVLSFLSMHSASVSERERERDGKEESGGMENKGERARARERASERARGQGREIGERERVKMRERGEDT